MKIFTFIHKKSSAIMTLASSSSDEANEEMFELVKITADWYLDEEEEDDSWVEESKLYTSINEFKESIKVKPII